MKERIIKFIESEKISAGEFADKIGVQRSSVSHVLNGRNNPGFSFIQKILETYPKINSRWLILGEGNMFDDRTTATTIHKPNADVQQNSLFSNIEKQELQNSSIDTFVRSPKNEKQIEREIKKVDDQVSELKKVTKVLMFYNDQTFEVFTPKI